MQLKTHLLVALAAVMVAPVMFTACGGPECGTGTTEQDGECVPTAAPVTCDENTELNDGKCVSTVTEVTCAAGTNLENGECVLDAAGCGEGTSLVDGACVADDPDLSGACGDGTSFDSAAGECVADSTVTCGANTVENAEGNCVPDSSVLCTAGTLANADGVCVVDAAACGGNTILDPNTNTCVVNDTNAYCGANTAFDADSESCVPTGDVCDAGTTFNDMTGLCLPDAVCRMGDVIVNGVCATPAEEAFVNADVTVDEAADRAANNDDVNQGGTATPLTIPAMGMAVTAAGQINVPVDLDGDGAVDQDVDSYTITGTAGQLFTVAVQPLSGPPLAFVVTNDDGSYQRLSTAGLTPGAARQILLPADGTYTINVTSAIAITGPAAPVGNDNWNYVLSVEEVAAPMSTDVDTSMGPIAGDFANLTDNLYNLTNFTGGEIVTFSADSIGDDVGVGYMQIWASPTDFVGEFEIGAGDTVTTALPSGAAYAFFDWGFVSGPDTSFEVSATPLPNQENLGPIAAGGTVNSGLLNLLDDDTRYVSFSVAPGEVIEISHTNVENDDVDYILRGPDGNEITDDFAFQPTGAGTPEFDYVYSPNGGTYAIEATAKADITDAGFNITSITPTDAGSFDIGGSIQSTDAAPLDRNRSKFLRINLANNVSATGSLLGGGGETTADLKIFDAVTGVRLVNVTSGTAAIELGLLPSGDHIVEVDATSADLPSGYVLDLTLEAPPVLEVEPNDDLATAQAVTLPLKLIGTGGYTGGGVPSEYAGNDVPFDFYTFTLAQDLALDEVLYVGMDSIAPVDATGSTDITLHDSMGVPIETASTNSFFEVRDLTAGTYFITVSLGFDTSFDTQYLITSEVLNKPRPVTLDGSVGDSCAAPIPVNMSGTFEGDLTNFTATESQRPCLGSTGDNGSDVFFSVTVPDGQTLTASVGNGTDFVAYLVNTCADIATNTCIDSDDSGNPETVTVTNTTGAAATYIFSFYTYFSSGSGTFDVTIDIQ